MALLRLITRLHQSWTWARIGRRWHIMCAKSLGNQLSVCWTLMLLLVFSLLLMLLLLLLFVVFSPYNKLFLFFVIHVYVYVCFYLFWMQSLASDYASPFIYLLKSISGFKISLNSFRLSSVSYKAWKIINM